MAANNQYSYKLSIITINFNNLSGLKRTVESVVNQTRRECEYIIIDGGSTDGSAEYISEMKNNFAFCVSEPDKGIYNAMNKGTNENTNGLVRGFFPKGTDFNIVTKEKLNWVQNALNERPRQTLEFNTPKETFNSLLLKY